MDICLTMPRWIISYDQMYQGDYYMYIYIYIIISCWYVNDQIWNKHKHTCIPLIYMYIYNIIYIYIYINTNEALIMFLWWLNMSGNIIIINNIMQQYSVCVIVLIFQTIAELIITSYDQMYQGNYYVYSYT